MIGPITSNQEIYVAACGKPFLNRWQSRFHEERCPYCHQEMCDRAREDRAEFLEERDLDRRLGTN